MGVSSLVIVGKNYNKNALWEEGNFIEHVV